MCIRDSVEWAWLESYHAADAPALTLADLAGLDEAALLQRVVRCHPAMRIVMLSRSIAPLVDPDFAPDVQAVLVARPDAEVRLFAITDADVAALAAARESALLGNLVAHLAERHPEGGAAVAALIAAGAFERV